LLGLRAELFQFQELHPCVLQLAPVFNAHEETSTIIAVLLARLMPGWRYCNRRSSAEACLPPELCRAARTLALGPAPKAFQAPSAKPRVACLPPIPFERGVSLLGDGSTAGFGRVVKFHGQTWLR
jgi:hypothetical protein